MGQKKIAIIYEGEKTEKQLIENINKLFFAHEELLPIAFPAGENIYMLWKQLKKDDFTTDIIEVLREQSKQAEVILKEYSRLDFMEIYLFFDYDGHANNLSSADKVNSTEVIMKMLETFSDETDLGKLYINYPMVESLRDNFPVDTCFRRCFIPIHEIHNYKQIVHELLKNRHSDFQDFRKLTKDDWKILCEKMVCKVNCVLEKSYSIPSRTEYLRNVGQKRIFEEQIKQFIIPNETIAVLNSFPLFILEYFKEFFWKDMLEKS